jgi:hypothetical protein
MDALPHALRRVAAEPPVRLLSRALLSRLPVSIQTRARWDLSIRPAYLLGLTIAAKKASENGIWHLCALEFGVAAGAGLLTLAREAQEVERSTGVHFSIYGFDAGTGLPATTGDYRDHPDYWQGGDFKMDVDRLRARLDGDTRLILGDVRDTVPSFVADIQDAPLGFVSFDLDLYSSTRDALRVFTEPKSRSLLQTPLYFDDIQPLISHRFAGELLAIDEFNAGQSAVRIDRWYRIHEGRPFPEAPYLNCMYVAHNIAAITAWREERVSRTFANEERV